MTKIKNQKSKIVLRTFLIKNVNIAPMDKNRVLRNHFVLIENGIISKIAPMANLNFLTLSNADVVEGRGGYLLPGLFDMHVHIHPENKHQFYNLFLSYGVTAVRDAGNDVRTIFLMKREVARGKILGPELFICGSILEGNPPIWDKKYSRVVKSPSEARRFVRYFYSKGVDFIKIYSSLESSVHRAVISEAHRLGLKVTGHVPFSMDIFGALKNGQDGIEHIDHIGQESFRLVFRNFFFGAQKLLRTDLDRPRFSRLLKELRHRRAAICPTLPLVLCSELYNSSFRTRTIPSPKTLVQLSHWLPKRFREELWNPNKKLFLRRRSKTFFTDRAVLFRAEQKLLPIIQKKRILILAGSDTANPFVVPGISLHQELKIMVESGLTPFEALATATRNAAQFLGVEKRLGTIASGKEANLVLFSKNPLSRISNLDTVRGVAVRGAFFTRKFLMKRIRRFK